MINGKDIITRFPPSPTGMLHVGNVRTALFNYFFARQNGGKFILRIEDTDKARSKKEYEEDMLAKLKWLGISHDNENLRHQSENTENYRKYLHKLIDDGKAYISEETEGENREVVRFKNPNVVITFEDLIRGTVSVNTADLGDFIIARNINDPVYHLAVVVDDFEQGITHVIRGEDHISNTPRQILIQEAIGAPRPIYAHLPLILAPDRSKLSKRKHGEMVSLEYYKNQGYLPEALVNFLGLLGFNPGGDKEIFSVTDFIKMFDFGKVQKGGAIFNVQKLDWINKEYIKAMNRKARIKQIATELASAGIKNVEEKILLKIDSVVAERISKFGEVKEMAERGELNFFFKKPEFSKEKLLWKNKDDFSKTKNHLGYILEKISGIADKDWNKETTKNAIWDYAEKEGRGNVLWPLRYSLSGMEKSPDPFTLADLLGKQETLERISWALNLLS